MHAEQYFYTRWIYFFIHNETKFIVRRNYFDTVKFSLKNEQKMENANNFRKHEWYLNLWFLWAMNNLLKSQFIFHAKQFINIWRTLFKYTLKIFGNIWWKFFQMLVEQFFYIWWKKVYTVDFFNVWWTFFLIRWFFLKHVLFFRIRTKFGYLNFLNYEQFFKKWTYIHTEHFISIQWTLFK